MTIMPFSPEPLTQDNAALILVDHQVGLMTGIRDYSVAELKHNVVGLARAAKALGLPIVTTTTSSDSLWGPAFPELVAALPGTRGVEPCLGNPKHERSLAPRRRATNECERAPAGQVGSSKIFDGAVVKTAGGTVGTVSPVNARPRHSPPKERNHDESSARNTPDGRSYLGPRRDRKDRAPDRGRPGESRHSGSHRLALRVATLRLEQRLGLGRLSRRGRGGLHQLRSGPRRPRCDGRDPSLRRPSPPARGPASGAPVWTG